jgi:hypothetical protein
VVTLPATVTWTGSSQQLSVNKDNKDTGDPITWPDALSVDPADLTPLGYVLVVPGNAQTLPVTITGQYGNASFTLPATDYVKSTVRKVTLTFNDTRIQVYSSVQAWPAASSPISSNVGES